MKFHRFILKKHAPTLTPTTKQGYSQLLMNTFHLKKEITSSDIDFFGMKKIGPNREIGDISGYPIFRYGDYIHLEVVLRASKIFCSRVATSMGAVYSNYNHTLYIHTNSLLEQSVNDHEL